ncbi:MAG TPA: AAA family ATPase, partial [Gemmataceae bacterium]|nr:AAA family ATPase [Gemmataceae bacterium]
MSSLLEWLLLYRRLGWSAVPACPPDHVGVKPQHVRACAAPGETPLFGAGAYDDRLPSESELRTLANFAPARANVGLLLGTASRTVALETNEPFSQWCRQSGETPPPTLAASGPRGKERVFFRLEAGERVQTDWVMLTKGGPSARVWGMKTCLLLPPGSDAEGFAYEWQQGCGPHDLPLAPCPGWLRELMGLAQYVPERALSSEACTVPEAPAQSQCAALSPECSVDGQNPVGATSTQPAYREPVPCASESIPDPLLSAPASTPAASLCPEPSPLPSQEFVSLTEVAPRDVRWLWPGWIPAGKVTILDGDPGAGKSTVMLDVAARLSRGREMPDGQQTQAGAVILLTAEDGLDDTVRPRLEAAAADLARCHAWQTVNDDCGLRPPRLPHDLPVLLRRVHETGARLVIVDPFFAYLDLRMDSYREQHVRHCLHQLSDLCARTGVAAVLVRHLTKDGTDRAVYRGGGSIGIIGAARAGMLLARDPEHPAGRVLASTKSNLAESPLSLALHLETVRGRLSRVIWDGPTAQDADSLLAAGNTPEQHSRLQEAVVFLRSFLGNCPRSATDVFKAAATAGITPMTLRRAKEKLDIYSCRQRYSYDGYWQWVLPGWQSSCVC